MDFHPTPVNNTSDLLALPNRTTIYGDDEANYILIKESFQYGPHLLLVSLGGTVSRTPLSEMKNNPQHNTPGQFTAITINN